MFGLHDVPLRIVHEGISFSIERDRRSLLYKRECMDEEVENIFLSSNSRVLINPIEPLNMPKELTPYLLIEFEKSIFIEPMTNRKIFLTFPVEIGIFVHGKKEYQIIDVLTLAKQKFTLYGSVKSGIICKYWKSDVYSTMPDINPIYEGGIELNLTNTTTRWVEVTKAVFNAYGMKIYYSDDMVSMKANMKILSKKIAEISFVGSHLKKGMKRSLELYISRKIPMIATKFLMEEGI
ncbi:MAG: DUF432 domain-containing protein [Methanosarcinales archaeon]|nr:DUF432 domain-containing protein [Methanosarcinales archaeon]